MISEPISYFQDLPFRLYMMSATVITPQLLTTLQDIIDSTSWDSDLHRCASQTLQRCQDYSRRYLLNVSKQLDIPTETLLLAHKLYGLLDAAILTASVEEKINLFEAVYLSTLKQTENQLPYYVHLQTHSYYLPAAITNDDLHKLADIIQDCTEDIEAWLDIQLADEYDDFNPNQPDLDPVVELLSSLQILTVLLLEHKNIA